MQASREGYKRYVLATLTLVYTLHYLDRGLMGLLLQSLKIDLALSDTQLGFLTGIAFGLFYAVLGVPLARWADRGNRVTVTSMAIGLWGLTVMACLLVTNFFQLACARVAAAVGEAGCMPPTYSLVGDYFPDAAERTRAIVIYMIGGPVSALLSYVAGGWLNEHYGWRVTFFLMGVPALLLAVLVKLTVIEPRSAARVERSKRLQVPGFVQVLKVLWGRRAARHLSIAIILLWMLMNGMNPWYAAFMIRSHGMETSELGVWLGLAFGLGGIAGVLLSGYVASRWFDRNEPGQVRMTAVVITLLVPFYALFLFLPVKGQALVALVPSIIVFAFFLGPTFALLQRLVADETRATTLSVVLLLGNLLGMGAGPQVVGYLSDRLMPLVGSDSLRYAMLLMSFTAVWAAYHFWRVGDTVAQDLAGMKAITGTT